MIKLKTILSELLLSEALPPSVAKEYTSIKRNKSIQQRLDSIFTKLTKLEGASTSKRGDRVYFPFSTSDGMVTHESPVKKEVEAALQGTDFKLKDYKLGVVVDKYGRETKLGKALAKVGKTDLVNKFNSDKTRESAKKTDFIIVFSKHPYDIAGMSTDRGWTSCMDLYDGVYKKHVQWDVKEGSFICYLTKPEDTNLNKPTGRVLVKPYINIKDMNDVIYSPEQRVYGTAPDQFLSTVNNVLSDIQGERVGKFKLSQKLYCDTGSEITKYPKPIQDIIDGRSKPKDKSEVETVLGILNIKNYTINSDLTVDVDDDVEITDKHLSIIPVQFRNVSGFFDCNRNMLTSLNGAPQKVGDGFMCGSNQLRTLEGGPQKVGGGFYCSNNKLRTLKGSPQSVGGDFKCSNNQLTSLDGAPKSVGGDFRCDQNKLTSLNGAPQKVDNNFDCSYNRLTTLEGGPQKVGNTFWCSSNDLRTLDGAPKSVGGDFSCNSNELTTLEGAPKSVGLGFYCGANKLTTLKGAPQSLRGDFKCSFNQLRTLEDAPKSVGGEFQCYRNDPPLPQSEIDWAEKNIKAKKFEWG